MDIPAESKLLSLKPMVQSMYQLNDDEMYSLVTDQQVLNALLSSQLCQSYVNMWSKYHIDAANPSITKAQLNCRLLDLCYRAQKLEAQYMDYHLRQPTYIVKLPFHSWITTIAPKENYVNDATAKAYSSKKAILKSWPLSESNRNRVFSIVNDHGLGILACEDLVYFGDIPLLTTTQFEELRGRLNEVHDALTTLFDNTSISESFKTSAASASSNDIINSISGDGKTAQFTA
ncbi:hypothetical protein BCR42DRAFT_414102 [Absidia repens]|uniref:Uncharacterized protein n=1 Tax=Absidia repens TaxID=90262 RepID=A0A1X2IK71_9FUNG|nr:hypothetical protein BCR42DRAFT_414102 [Absidia repens]